MTDVTDRPQLRRLEALVGTWAATEHTKDTILGPGVPVTYTETFHWLEGGTSSCRSTSRWQPWMDNTFTRTDERIGARQTPNRTGRR